MLCLWALACAATNRPDLDQATWSLQQGAPADIWDMAQAEDGGLWLATGAGLYRFDGQRFQRKSPDDGHAFPSSNMTALDIQGDTVWIGYYGAGISRLQHGRLSHYGPGQGLAPGMVRRIAHDAGGRVWAAQRSGLHWFDGRRWQAPAPALGYPGGAADWLLLDRQGRLWVCGEHGLLYLPRDGGRFIATGIPVSRLSVLAESPAGEIWLADRLHGLSPVADGTGPLTAKRRQARTIALPGPALHTARLRFSHDGSLWGSGRADGGIFHIVFDAAGRPHRTRLGEDQGLSSNTASPLLEDREGNLWIGTNRGLDRFRDRALHALPPRPVAAESAETLFRSSDGRLYTYAIDDPPIPLDRTALAPLLEGQRPPLPADAQAWTVGCRRLEHWHGLHGQPTALPGNASACDIHAYDFASDEEGWACASAHVYRYDRSGWSIASGLPPQPCSTVIAPTPGVAVLGYADGSVVLLQAGRTRRFDATDGLDVGAVSGLYYDHGLLLVAGDNGLAVRAPDGRFGRVRSNEDNLLDGINGIIGAPGNQLWLYGIGGLASVRGDSLLRSARTGTILEDLRRFDATDGLPGPSQQASLTPTLALASDGLLWLSSNQGLAWLDIRRPYRNRVAPTVQIGDVHHDGLRHPLHDGDVLPKGTTQLQIGYAATSLARPDRVRFRTRLLGLEDAWRDAGALTQASFANLGPGRYRFQVQAANEDGVWSTGPATRDFQIAPTFVQTAAFKLLCIVAFALLLALAMRFRSEQVAARVRAGLEQRHQERERIARELHDTLLQGTQGLILRLHAAAQRLPHQDPLREELDRAMDLAEHALAQGRERVQGLRHATLGSRELGTALLQVRDELAVTDAPLPSLLLEGQPRPLQPAVGEELYLLCREALLNAFRHARASAIEIEIGYGRQALSVRIRDDGLGLAEDAPHRPGHFGLRGMHERAARIGAELQLWSRPHAGTEVQIIVPRARAYLHARRRWPLPARPSSGDPA